MRIPQSRGSKGSLKWIQTLVGEHPAVLEDAVRAAAGQPPTWQVSWVSPLASDAWAEYRDRAFLVRLGLGRLANDLDSFWPRGGPQWDGLGRSSDGGVVLIEAKSHKTELNSSCDASPASLSLITKSLDSAKAAFGVPSGADWLNGFYQYSNRLAHLHFFQQHSVPSRLVFVYFVSDQDMGGPNSPNQWREFLNSVYVRLGFEPSHELPGLSNIFINVATIPPTVAA
jgi:hypothetical protein